MRTASPTGGCWCQQRLPALLLTPLAAYNRQAFREHLDRNHQNEDFMQSALLVLLGVAAGAASGLVGIGGGIILVPALVFLFGLSQHQAQGTTLALMVPPLD